MGRSLKKGPFVEPKLIKKVLKQKETGDRSPIKTWSRRCTVVPEFVNHTFDVHNGNKFHKVFIVEDMVGHKLGEFSPTRVFRGHTTKGKSAAAAAPAK
jgi:small subunit ribosomal protein S19